MARNRFLVSSEFIVACLRSCRPGCVRLASAAVLVSAAAWGLSPLASPWAAGLAALADNVPFAGERGEGAADLVHQRQEGLAKRFPSGHHHVIVIGARLKRFGGAERLFQPATHPIADDRIADFLGDGETHSRARLQLARRPFRRLQGESAREFSVRPVTPAEIGPASSAGKRAGRGRLVVLAQGSHSVGQGRANALRAGTVRRCQAESFLRPRARRALRTLRPPTVAMRARKP